MVVWEKAASPAFRAPRSSRLECLWKRGPPRFYSAMVSRAKKVEAEIPESCIKSVAGNEMHVQVIGTMLAFVLACTVPAT